MNDELGEAYLSQRWNDRIRDAVFLDAIPSEHPVTVFLGGQPAAGKTDAYSLIEEMIPSIVPINGDDFRRFHPLYDLLLQYNPLGMPTATASASATWIAMTVAYANEHHYSSIIEGTWRDQSVVLNEAINAKKTGRGTWAMIVATKPSISRIGTLTRYLDKLLVGQIARWTPPSSHERVIRSLHSTVAAIAQDNRIDRFTVIDRHGETLADGHHRMTRFTRLQYGKNISTNR